MASLYSVLPGIQPTSQEIVEAELLAVQILQAQYPDLDLRLGTGLRDLLIRPVAMMLALTKKGLDYYFNVNTITGVTNNTPTDVIDSIMSNWFITRNLGTRAVINARLYFARQKNSSVTSDVYFSPDNTLKYYSSESLSISASDMAYDSSSNEWYIDLDLTAGAEGTQYNLSEGSLLYFSNFDPYFLRAEINYLKTASISSETNSEFLSRASTAISTRNLVNVPSIDSNIRAEFNYINEVTTVGMGDPEMIRDEIRAVFDDQIPRILSQLTSAGTLATGVLDNHGFHNGQLVEISGAAPTTYNGQYNVQVVDANTFTYNMVTSASAVTSLPTAVEVNLPILMHNGGMVDIYCDKALASSVVQVTTDQYGTGQITGAVYEYSRSQISGGSADDTIPFNTNVTIGTTNVHTDTGVINVGATNHGLSPGYDVTLSGLTQTVNIQSIVCSGLTVTVVAPNHGIPNGASINIIGVSPVQYTGTFTAIVVDANTINYVVPANITSAGSGTSMQINNPSIAGSYSISNVMVNSFDITVPSLWNGAGVTTTNAIVLSYQVPYSFSNPNVEDKPIVSISCTGTTVTVTMNKHGYTANRYVTISGVTPSEYNGVWLISSVLNVDQFTYTVPANIPTAGSAAPSSAMTGTFVIPWNDLGFSNRQTINVNFGPAFANMTASFQIGYFQNIASVQNYLDNPSNRIVCADLLARGFNFYLLDVGVVSYNGVIPNETVLTQTITAYLASLSPGATFVMSDLISQLNAAGINGIKTPLDITFKKYTRDLVPVITGTIVDYLDPNDITNVFLLNSVSSSNVTV